MWRRHLDALKPVCPRCRLHRQQFVQIVLQTVLREDGDYVIEGVLHCPAPECLLEYPIIDGIPILVPDVRSYVSDNLDHLVLRKDLSPTIESMLGDGAGQGTVFDTTRQHLSTYAWDGYGDLDSAETESAAGNEAPGAIVRCLDAGLALLAGESGAPVLDAGCAVGRTTFELAARTDGLVLGVDLNFSMLRLAMQVLRDGRVSYPRRRIGVVYDHRDFEVSLAGRDRVDFWACDALALPVPDRSFQLAVALNLLDCVASPQLLLQSLATSLQIGGQVVLSTPYDWSNAATAMEGWIGGHSQRGPGAGAAEPILRTLLTPDAHPQSIGSLRITGEIADLPWHARMHERSNVSYSVHVAAAEVVGDATGPGDRSAETS